MTAVEPDGEWPEQDSRRTDRSMLRRWGRSAGIAAALGMSLIFAAAAWYALQRADMQPPVMVETPLVKAEPGPVKQKPEDPGGLKIPNQDKLVYERITPKPEIQNVEKLAPAPEEPIVRLSAPAAPAIVSAQSSVVDDKVAAPAAESNPAASEPATKQAAALTASSATAREHAAPPAIASNADTATAPKVESLLPAAANGPKASVNEPAATKPAAQAKALPKTKAEPAATATAKAPNTKTPVASAPAAEKATSGYRIQMASYRKGNLADAAWDRLRKAHADVLSDYSGYTTRADLGKRGTYYRVQAGPFENAAGARAACLKLKAKRQDCIIVPPQ